MEKKEAMKILKDFYDKSALFSIRTALDTIIPELKESKDEKIRKEIIEYIKIGTYRKDWIAWLESININDGYKDNGIISDIISIVEDAPSVLQKDKDTMISWLQKQSEQKPNKVEPKFKIGDWIIYDIYDTKDIDRIVKIDNDKVSFESGEWLYIYQLNKDCRLWTIQDAKDGDVLANDHHILILKELDYNWGDDGTPSAVKAYCGIKPNGNFELGKDNWCFCGTLHIHPATKEQRNTLFKAMADARYTFDFDKKELKKIDQPSSWSEEDEIMIDNIIDYMMPMPIFFESTKGKSGKEYTQEFITNAINWLRGIKGRVQPKQGWSKEVSIL